MEGFQLFAELDENCPVRPVLKRQFRLTAFFLLKGLEALACAFDGETLIVQQTLDLQQRLDVTPTIETVLRAGLAWSDAAELALPVAQDIGLNTDDGRYLANFEVQLVRKLCLGVRHVRSSRPGIHALLQNLTRLERQDSAS